MAKKTSAWTVILFGVLPAAAGAGQSSPLQWPLPKPGAVAARPEVGHATVDADWIASTLGQPGTVLLDVRDGRGWERWEIHPLFAVGHIPHALPFDPGSLLGRRGKPLKGAEIRRRLAVLGPRPNDPVSLDSTFVIYGQDEEDPQVEAGRRLLAQAGLDVRVFPGGWRQWQTEGRPIVRIVSAAEVAALLRRDDPDLSRDAPPAGVLLFDLREARDFAIGHLPGATSLPFDQLAATFEQRVAQGWPGADRSRLPLVFYCYGPECIRSREAGAQAARLGFRNVLWFRGGLREWTAAGLPLRDPRASGAATAGEEGSPPR